MEWRKDLVFFYDHAGLCEHSVVQVLSCFIACVVSSRREFFRKGSIHFLLITRDKLIVHTVCNFYIISIFFITHGN